MSVFSMACLELREKQDQNYKDKLLNCEEKVYSVEASVNKDFAHICHGSIGVRNFGESAPAGDLQKHFEFTKDDITKKILLLEHLKLEFI